jgi:rare lipoprotein A
VRPAPAGLDYVDASYSFFIQNVGDRPEHPAPGALRPVCDNRGDPMRATIGLTLAALLLFAHGAPARAADPHSLTDYEEQGQASFYGPGWHGRRTASGAVFDMHALTAAHRWLPFGTRVRVRLAETGEEVEVMITDRLRSARRVIDLSLGAAQALGIVRRGVAQVIVVSAE